MSAGSRVLIARNFVRPCSLVLLFTAAIALATKAVAQQDDVAAFYRGRTVQAVVGYTPGSTFELYLRTFARHLGRHSLAIR